MSGISIIIIVAGGLLFASLDMKKIVQEPVIFYLGGCLVGALSLALSIN